jgi:hypothetical protein
LRPAVPKKARSKISSGAPPMSGRRQAAHLMGDLGGGPSDPELVETFAERFAVLGLDHIKPPARQHELDRGDEGRPFLRRQALGPLAARLAPVLVRVEFNIPFGIFISL